MMLHFFFGGSSHLVSHKHPGYHVVWLDFLKFPVLGCHGVTFIARMWSLLWAAVAVWTVCDVWADDVFRVVLPLITFGDLAHGVAPGNFYEFAPEELGWPPKRTGVKTFPGENR